MRLNLKGIGAAALGLSACALGFVACGVDSAPSLTLSSFHSLEPDGENSCSVDTDPYSGGAYFAAEGAQTGQGYIVYVRIENSMPPNDDDELGRLDTNWVQLTEVEIFYPRQGPWSYLPASRKQPAGVKIDSEGELFHAVTAIAPDVAALMVEGTEGAPSPIGTRGTCESILLTFQARGKLGDGSTIETNKIDFPVNVCNVFNACPVIEEGCSTAQPDGFTCGELDEEPGGPGAGGSGGLPGTGGTGGDDTGAGGAGGDLGTGGIGGDLVTGGTGGIGGDLGTGGDGGSII